MGKLLYLATTTRPDIAVAVGILCRKTSSSSKRDWTAVKRVARYLKGTAHLKLKLQAINSPKLETYTDEDWAGDTTDRKSTSGKLLFFGDGPVSWTSKKQDTVAVSSTEAEYVSVAQACQELKCLCQLLEDLGIIEPKPMQILEDNQSCIKLSQTKKNQFAHQAH